MPKIFHARTAHDAQDLDAITVGIDVVENCVGEPHQRPAEEIPAFLDAADVLVSPRSLGTNTPLKIYQYLRSGRPIVATRLLTHTQVLDDEVAILTEPTAAGTRSCARRRSCSSTIGTSSRSCRLP